MIGHGTQLPCIRHSIIWAICCLKVCHFLHCFPNLNQPFSHLLLPRRVRQSFSAQSVALRTEHDPVQVVWKNGQKQNNMDADVLQSAIQEYLLARGEPTNYLYVHTAGLIALAEAGALKKTGQEFDEALRKTNALIKSALKDDERFIHYSTGESVETGMWGLAPSTAPRDLRSSTHNVPTLFRETK